MDSWDDLGIDISLIKNGRGKTHCPKCHHTRKREHQREKELFVDTVKGGYYCHNLGCEWNKRGLYLDAGERDAFAPRWERPTLPPTTGLTSRGRQWLTDRSIDPDVALGMGVYDDGRTLSFPYFRDGRLIHVKHRDMSNKRWWSSADTEPVFYNLDAVEEATTVYIVEGELDVLALASAGITNVISVPNGAPGEGQDAGSKLACMTTTSDLFAGMERVIIAADNDAPGRSLAAHLVRRIGPEKCWRVDWPNGTKDANEALENYGADGLLALLAEARPEPYKGLIYGHDVADDVWDSRTLPLVRGVSTGIPSLDRYYRPDIGHATIWSGTPSSGKSAFVAFVMHNIAASKGWRYVIFTPETFPQAEWYREMAQIHTGKPISHMTEPEYRQAMAWIGDHFILQSPVDPTLDEILEHARVCVQRHGTNAVVIDPFTNVLPPKGEGNMSSHDTIGRALTRINQFKLQYACHMDVVAHPTKPFKKGDGSIEPIGPYDISGSSNWFNMSDEMVMVHRTDRNNDDAPVDIKVWKMRSRYHGKTGATQVQFDMRTGRYTDLGQPF